MHYKIIGGRALAFHIPEWDRVNDLDYWTTGKVDSLRGFDGVLMPEDIMAAFNQDSVFASINDVYTIKISHMPWDIFWNKHKQDVLFLKKKGAKLNHKLYELLKPHWQEKHGNKPQLSLNRSKDSFFDDAVVKVYDHDYLHELVAHPHIPVYRTVLKDGHEVLTDRNKFLALPFGEKVRMLREEIYVIMLERWVIPQFNNPKKLTVPQAWALSLRKTVTALTKGVYSEFICENLEYFLMPNRNDLRHVFKTLKLEN